MGQKEKLIKKLKSKPKDMTFEEAETLLKYLAYDADKEEKLLDNQKLLKTPVVRNGKKATVGYAPDTWKDWE